MILKGAHDTQPQRNELEYLGIFMTFFLLTITNRARSEKFVPAFFSRPNICESADTQSTLKKFGEKLGKSEECQDRTAPK